MIFLQTYSIFYFFAKATYYNKIWNMFIKNNFDHDKINTSILLFCNKNIFVDKIKFRIIYQISRISNQFLDNKEGPNRRIEEPTNRRTSGQLLGPASISASRPSSAQPKAATHGPAGAHFGQERGERRGVKSKSKFDSKVKNI